MLTAAQVLVLAQRYSEALGISLSGLGKLACQRPHRRNGNDKIFKRLAAGHGCSSASLEMASEWFAAHWPPDVEWPREIPHPKRAA